MRLRPPRVLEPGGAVRPYEREAAFGHALLVAAVAAAGGDAVLDAGDYVAHARLAARPRKGAARAAEAAHHARVALLASRALLVVRCRLVGARQTLHWEQPLVKRVALLAQCIAVFEEEQAEGLLVLVVVYKQATLRQETAEMRLVVPRSDPAAQAFAHALLERTKHCSLS